MHRSQLIAFAAGMVAHAAIERSWPGPWGRFAAIMAALIILSSALLVDA